MAHLCCTYFVTVFKSCKNEKKKKLKINKPRRIQLNKLEILPNTPTRKPWHLQAAFGGGFSQQKAPVGNGVREGKRQGTFLSPHLSKGRSIFLSSLSASTRQPPKDSSFHQTQSPGTRNPCSFSAAELSCYCHSQVAQVPCLLSALPSPL